MARKKKNKEKNLYLFEAVLATLKANSNKAMNYKQVAASIDVTDDAQKIAVSTVLEELASRGLIRETERGKYKTKESERRYITGKVDMTQSGSAYIINDELEEDIFVPQKFTKGVMQGDTVKVLLLPKKRDGKPEGQIIEVVERGRTEFVGSIKISPRFAFLIPDNNKVGTDIYIPLERLNGAKDGQKVIAKIIEWPKNAVNPIGEVIDVLGNAGENNTEMHAILAEFGLPYSFPKEIEKLADHIPTEITADEIKKRKDFREITTFTIDPSDAKDFDDALSIKKLANGNWEIGVHIADVTHYVKEGTPIDNEGFARATSVYLVDRVVPMLPEALSNNLCSLRPNEDKLCFAAVFELNDSAEIQDSWFGRTIIHSDKRFTYEEAQEQLEDGRKKLANNETLLSGKENNFQSELITMDNLAKKLRADRMRKGSIAFEKAEVKFHLDEVGNPTGVFFKQMKDSNKLIEDFMLLANRKVAEYVGKKAFEQGKEKKQGNLARPFVYRIHNRPDQTRLEELGSFVNKFGYKINTQNDKSTADSLNKLLKDVEGKGESSVISLLTIRTMAKAVYSTKNIGHYGLGFEYYSHFTSPIRRFPDMMAHRLLQYYLDIDAGKKQGNAPDEKELELQCKHSSEMEKLAADAERASIKYKQVQFLQDKIGEQFDGIVSGVTEWGIFVEIKENHCEGMIRMRDLTDDAYYFDEENYCVTGRKYKRSIRLGDGIRIEIKRADLAKKQLDFIFIETIDNKKEEAKPTVNKQTEAREINRQKQKAEKTKNTGKPNKGSVFNDEWGFEV